MIPESKGFNTLLRQKFFPRFIPLDAFRRTVLKAVEFDIQLRVRAVTIQNVSTNGMLPAKLEASELSSSQGSPKFFFFVGLMVAEFAGDLCEAHAGRMRVAEKNSSSSPRPSPRLAKRG